MKTILNISDVFSRIERNRHGQIMASYVTLSSGQIIPLSKNLKRLYYLGDLTCSECGCCGTHLQQHFQETGDQKTEVWRVMTWSKSGNRVSFLNLDHIVAQSHGGTWDQSNLRVTCEYCNILRGNRPIVEEEPGISVGEVMKFLNAKVKIKRKVRRLQELKGILVKRLKQLSMNFKRVAYDVMRKVLTKILPQVGIQPTDELFAQMIPA